MRELERAVAEAGPLRFQKLTDTLARRFARARVCLACAEGETLRVVAYSPPSEGVVGFSFPAHLSMAFVSGQSFYSEEGVFLPGLGGASSVLADSRCRAILELPLLSGRRVLAVLCLFSASSISPQVVRMLEELAPAIGRLCDGQQAQPMKPTSLIYRSEAVRRVVERALRVADKPEINILLVGETGVGKDLLAREVHNQSQRRSQPFLDVRCAELPPTLMESELFGYRRGAFTGANLNYKKGLVESAEGGTLFLNEISRIPVELQPKLLRLLEYREIFSIGSTRGQPVDVRIISATNQDPAELISSGRLLPDLYYRMKGLELVLPPLRERREDIILLAEHFAAACGRMLDDELKVYLFTQEWPGNVRELENLVRTACAFSDSRRLGLAALRQLSSRDLLIGEEKLESMVRGYSELRASNIVGISRYKLKKFLRRGRNVENSRA